MKIICVCVVVCLSCSSLDFLIANRIWAKYSKISLFRPLEINPSLAEHDMPCVLANSVDPDQLAFEEAN